MVRRSRLRVARAVAASVTLGGALVAVMAGVACITAPPPDLPQLPDQPPSIDHDAVFPPQGPLTEWPDGGFTIPVRMAKPGEAFFYTLMYDYGTPIQSFPVLERQVSALPDGGEELISLAGFKPPNDTRVCPHHIEFVVAARFLPGGTTPNAVGGDVVAWTYIPAGTPVGCPAYDAGTGAFDDAGDQ